MPAPSQIRSTPLLNTGENPPRPSPVAAAGGPPPHLRPPLPKRNYIHADQGFADLDDARYTAPPTPATHFTTPQAPPSTRTRGARHNGPAPRNPKNPWAVHSLQDLARFHGPALTILAAAQIHLALLLTRSLNQGGWIQLNAPPSIIAAQVTLAMLLVDGLLLLPLRGCHHHRFRPWLVALILTSGTAGGAFHAAAFFARQL